MSMNVGGSKGASMADINVTPMADIMIVLLIIFMVITPMLQKGVDVRLPTASNTKERKDEPKTIIVAVKQDGTTYLNGIKMDNPAADLTRAVKERLEEMADTGKGGLPEGRRGPPLLGGHEGHGLLPRGGGGRDRPHRRAESAGLGWPKRTPQPHKKKPVLHSHDATRPVTLGATSDINITPLIDVMLVLLIIFMVVTPLAQKGLDIALPQPPRPTSPSPRPRPTWSCSRWRRRSSP